MRKSLFNLLANNAKAGTFQAEGNTLYLYDVIVGSELEAEYFGGVAPTAFAKALKGMSGPVALRINSPGGDVMAARAMAQAMREYDGEITAHVDGLAASAATIISSAADRVVMAPGGLFMIHKAWTMMAGNADDFLTQSDLLEKVDGTIAETYAAKGKGDVDHYAALMAAETWFTPAEALAEGLIDEVVDEQAKGKAKAWNLTAFNNAPQIEPEPEQVPVLQDTTETDRQRRIRAAKAIALSA
jgi:ATP-dependent Clp protease protease subunit